jgi:hypothetical protein
MLEGILGKVGELANQADSFTASAFAGFADKGLVWKMAHVNFKVLDFVGQQETVGHETVVTGEEALEATDDYAENVFLCKMLF